MSSFESVLSWLQSDEGTAILVLLGCTVLVLSAVFGIWQYAKRELKQQRIELEEFAHELRVLRSDRPVYPDHQV